MKINKVEKTMEDKQVKLSSKIDTKKGSYRLWFAVDREYEEYIDYETADAFLTGLFVHAMHLREDIYIDSPVSEKLYFNISNNIMKIYNVFNSMFQEVSIYPKYLNSKTINIKSNNVATGFSGGIDSFNLLLDYYFSNNVPASYKVTHLVYNNVGAHGNNSGVFFHKRFEHLKNFTEEYNIPFIKIDSNLDKIVDSEFLSSVLPRNVASVLVLQKLFTKYLYASGYTFENFLTSAIYKKGYTEPLTHALYSTESMESVMIGSQKTRVEKTRQVAEFEASHKYLYVCTDTSLDHVENCSVCFKCARTLLTLEILGLQHLYKDVFDIQKFNSIKRVYIESILHDKDPLGKEILELATEKNYRIPKISKVLGMKYIFPLAQNIRKNVPYSVRQNFKKIIGLHKVSPTIKNHQ